MTVKAVPWWKQDIKDAIPAKKVVHTAWLQKKGELLHSDTLRRVR